MQRVIVYEVSKREDTVACDFVEFMELVGLGRDHPDHWQMAQGERDPSMIRCKRQKEPVQHFKDETGKSFYVCIGPQLRQVLESATESRRVQETRKQWASENKNNQRIIAEGVRAHQVTTEVLKVTEARAQRLKEDRLTFKCLPWYVRAWRAARNQL